MIRKQNEDYWLGVTPWVGNVNLIIFYFLLVPAMSWSLMILTRNPSQRSHSASISRRDATMAVPSHIAGPPILFSTHHSLLSMHASTLDVLENPQTTRYCSFSITKLLPRKLPTYSLCVTSSTLDLWNHHQKLLSWCSPYSMRVSVHALLSEFQNPPEIIQ